MYFRFRHARICSRCLSSGNNLRRPRKVISRSFSVVSLTFTVVGDYVSHFRPLCEEYHILYFSFRAHFMLPGLLQLSAVWNDRQIRAASIVGAEYCGKANHRSQTSRTHHTDIASVSLAAG